MLPTADMSGEPKVQGECFGPKTQFRAQLGLSDKGRAIKKFMKNHALHRKIESVITKNNTYWFINYNYDLNG